MKNPMPINYVYDHCRKLDVKTTPDPKPAKSAKKNVKNNNKANKG